MTNNTKPLSYSNFFISRDGNLYISYIADNCRVVEAQYNLSNLNDVPMIFVDNHQNNSGLVRTDKVKFNQEFVNNNTTTLSAIPNNTIFEWIKLKGVSSNSSYNKFINSIKDSLHINIYDIYAPSNITNHVFYQFLNKENYQPTSKEYMVCSFDIETYINDDFDSNHKETLTKEDMAFPSFEKPYYSINLLTCAFTKIKSKDTLIIVFVNNEHDDNFTIDKDYLNQQIEEKKGKYLNIVGIKYINCTNEKELLDNFMQSLRTYRPSILTGWYIKGFDIPYIIARQKMYYEEYEIKNQWNLIGQHIVSSSDVVNFYSITDKYTNEVKLMFTNESINVIDYKELYKKYELSPRDSYSLDNISRVELNSTKLKYVGTMQQFYKRDFTNFILYNIIDVIRVLEIDCKKGFLDLMFGIAYYSNAKPQDVLYNTRLWDYILHNDSYTRGEIMPYVNQLNTYRNYEGAFVKEVIRPCDRLPEDSKYGKPFTFASFDATSLYPNLIIQYNISPECKVRVPNYMNRFNRDDFVNLKQPSENFNDFLSYAKEHNLTATANGLLFSKHKQGIIPYELERLFNLRQSTKELMKQKKQQLMKLEQQLEELNNR